MRQRPRKQETRPSYFETRESETQTEMLFRQNAASAFPALNVPASRMAKTPETFHTSSLCLCGEFLHFHKTVGITIVHGHREQKRGKLQLVMLLF